MTARPSTMFTLWSGHSDLGFYTTQSDAADGKPFIAKQLFLTSLRTSPEALLRLTINRWNIEG